MILKEYLYKLEIEKKKLILYNKEYLSDLDKNQIIDILKMMLKIYQNKLELHIKGEKSTEYDFLNNLSYNNLQKKVNLLIDCLKKITYNVNLDLFMDHFVLDLEAINNEAI